MHLEYGEAEMRVNGDEICGQGFINVQHNYEIYAHLYAVKSCGFN
jgi:hypothetical protein